MQIALLMLALHTVPAFEEEIATAVKDVVKVFAVPPTLVRAVIKQESDFNPKALSKCGAIGLMQIMPFNAVSLGLRSEDELWVPSRNVLAGVRLLAALLQHYAGDVIASLVAYNSGPKAKLVVPENGETPGYVVNILKFWRAYERIGTPGHEQLKTAGSFERHVSSPTGQRGFAPSLGSDHVSFENEAF